MKKKQYLLDQIHCAGCTNKIEDRILRINGVSSCNLNFITFKLTIIFDENIISEIDLLKSINKCINGSKIINSKDLVISNDEINQSTNEGAKLRRKLFSFR